MKNTIYLLLLIIISGCSSNNDDNDNNPTTVDPFTGQWYFGPEVYKLDNGEDYIFPLNNCQDEGWFIFNSNGTGELFDSQEDINGDCIIEQFPGGFEWEKLDNSQYRFVGYSNDIIDVVFVSENEMYWRDTFGEGFEIDGIPYSERWSYFHK